MPLHDAVDDHRAEQIARPASIPCPLAAYCNATSTSCLRRAVSTAYYAVFHCLAGAAANLLVGRSRGSAWHRVYRALEHGKAKSACGHKQAMKRFQPEIRYFAETFVILQDARHRADYALEGRYYKLDVLADIDQAENTITQFEQTDTLHRRDFATHVLFRQRPSQEPSVLAP